MMHAEYVETASVASQPQMLNQHAQQDDTQQQQQRLLLAACIETATGQHDERWRSDLMVHHDTK